MISETKWSWRSGSRASTHWVQALCKSMNHLFYGWWVGLVVGVLDSSVCQTARCHWSWFWPQLVCEVETGFCMILSLGVNAEHWCVQGHQGLLDEACDNLGWTFMCTRPPGSAGWGLWQPWLNIDVYKATRGC